MVQQQHVYVQTKSSNVFNLQTVANVNEFLLIHSSFQFIRTLCFKKSVSEAVEWFSLHVDSVRDTV